ncbi:hypothetical protein [Staphylococcus hominis]|uniref:hypothetical protein n=1 Tax=Staphylococcus hominis TaxID=1290 RepID=UPI001597196D|nr:hypothetical protein FOC68_11060 [Staphylococcus hominis]QKH82821.1 hypothetical protein FOC68_11145 [Staphylococcus hominis]
MYKITHQLLMILMGFSLLLNTPDTWLNNNFKHKSRDNYICIFKVHPNHTDVVIEIIVTKTYD